MHVKDKSPGKAKKKGVLCGSLKIEMTIENIDDNTPANSEVFTKYKTAADIINRVLKLIISKCVVDANVFDLCLLGDKEIEDACSKVYNKGKMIKGVSFPTCISVNNYVCHYSPETDQGLVLHDGDVVKIELSGHIDGFPALLAHSLVVGSSTVTDKRADAITAAYYAAEAALRMIRPGNSNEQASEMMTKVIQEFGISSVQGTISFQLLKNTLGSDKYVILNPNDDQKKSHVKQTFEQYEVFAVDVAVSTSEGLLQGALGIKPTIYKKTDNNYALKMKASRTLLSDITSRFGNMAFSTRSLPNSKLGLVELINHELVQGYETMVDKDESAIVARFMFTIVLMPAGPLRITDFPVKLDPHIQSSKKIQSTEIVELLASDPRKKKK